MFKTNQFLKGKFVINLMKISQRNFGSGGHHHITGKVDLNKAFVPQSAENHKFVSLIGLNSPNPVEKGIIDDHDDAHFEITPFSIPLVTRSRKRFKRLASVRNEENPYLHPEPYGYLVCDDPYDPNPSYHQKYIPLLLGFIGVLVLIKMLSQTDKDNKNRIIDDLFHAHYTAGLIEDEIRRIREEDYPLRKRYYELKTGGAAVQSSESNSTEEEQENE